MPPCRSATSLTPGRAAMLLDEALRRIDADLAQPVDLDALRRALRTEQAKGPRTLAELVKVGRRRALDRLARSDRKASSKV